MSSSPSLSGPLVHPCVWDAAELESRDDWCITLSEVEIAEIRGVLEGEVRSNLSGLEKRLRKIQQDLEHGSGAVLIKGFPLDQLSEGRISSTFLRLMTEIGTPISQSASGEHVFSVRDSGFASDDPRARGPNTRKKLSFHTDRCDVIAFLCRNAARSGGENQIVSSARVYNEVLRRRPELVAVLLEPYYYARHTVDTGNENPWCQQPIFSFHKGHFASAFLRVLIERAARLDDLPDLSPIQWEALDFCEEIAAEPGMHLEFLQEPGDILLLNNWVTWHRRTEFADYEEVTLKRHILRIWLSVPNSRPLADWFLANYGATGAGEIRGGMTAAA